MQQPSGSGKRTAELRKLQSMLPACKAFDQWLAASGELPPDFDDLPAVPYPQDLLEIRPNGVARRVTAADWPQRRQELADLVEDWLLGHAPPAPGNVRGIVEERRQEANRETWNVRLEFGPNHAAVLHCWLWLPKERKGPLPCFLVDNLSYTRFAQAALDQGEFAICIYNATDPVYVTSRKDESEAYKDLFGKCDWSEFRRRGWSASRALDWLGTLDVIDKDRVFIGGHSRSAKQSLACAAFDPRIAGVVASSPGSGGSLHFRFCDQYYFGESAELLTRVFPYWVSPKVRFFTGRENRLPADCHMIYGLIAPRPVLMSTAIHDWVESTWAVEQMYKSIRPVYQLLGKPENLGVRYRPGQHSPDAATCADHAKFLMLAAAGKNVVEAFPLRQYHPWDYTAWAQGAAMQVDVTKLKERGSTDPTLDADGRAIKPKDWPQRVAVIKKEIEWLLGDGPEYRPGHIEIGRGESEEEAKRLARNFPAPPQRTRCRFGDGINANIYYPPGQRRAGRKLPAVVWLAPFHCSSGYTGTYRAGDIAHMRLCGGGFVTLAFDPIGTGGRQDERRGFYEKHPQWSLMGKMVRDARHAVDALRETPDVDTDKICLVGYGMGGMVALLAAALDQRVAGAVSVAGFTPFRTDTDQKGTGGVRRWSHLYGWLPRLGAFVGHEGRIPVDFGEILAAIAPRPTLMIAPTLDWHANHPDVGLAVELAQKAYGLLGAEQRLVLQSPERWNEFNNAMQSSVIEWLRGVTASGGR